MSQTENRPASSLVAFHSDSHKMSVLSRLDHLRKRNLLCDVTLVVEDVHFKAHKALLAASSEFFSVMFTAKDRIQQSTYHLDGMAAEMFAAVLEFIYSAQVSVEENAVERLLAAARLTEVRELVKVAGRSEYVKTGGAQTAVLLKRKRGRPKKDASARCQSSEKQQVGSPPSKDEAEPNISGGDPEGDPRRHSKRKIRPPVKYKSYKVGDAAGSKEPGKRSCRRKYPSSEARCDDCGKVFKHHLFLKIHQRTHTGEKPFHCLVCAKSFTQKHTLLAHQRIHTGEKPFVCTVCSKALSTKHSLQEHMNLHEGEKSYDCDKCAKSFSQKKQLKSHYRVHTGKSLPECDLCHHKFMDAAQLKKHLRTHTGEKPFTCEICGKCFTAKSTLQTHIRIHRGEKPFHCSICSKSFSDPSARRRHIASHSGRKPFTCSSCSLSFTRLDNLRTHTKSHNKEHATPAEAAADPPEEPRSVLQLQQYQEQEIQLVVTEGDVDFVPGHDQEIDLIAADGQSAPSAPSRLALLTQTSGHVQNVALVAQGDALTQSAPIHSVGMTQLAQQPEQMHIITLTKEAMEHLQGHHSATHPLQPAPRPAPQLQGMQPPLHQLTVTQEGPAGRGGREPHVQAIHVSSQSGQPICISQTSEQLSGRHIQGQTFQIQAGTVSYLYTTGLPHES